MEDKKPIMIGVIVACFAVAGLITYMTRSPSKGPLIPESFAKETIWLKCRNSSCEHEYQMNKKEYYEYMQQYVIEHPLERVTPPLTCPKCEKASAYRATKCQKCGLVFETGLKVDDFEDRCQCGYSQIEVDRRKAAEARRRKGG
jgi:ribosomal protein L40E